MREPRAIMISLMVYEYLRFIFQPAKGGGMDNPVTVTLEGAAHITFRLGVQPPARLMGMTGIAGEWRELHGFLVIAKVGNPHYIQDMEQSNESLNNAPFAATDAALKRIAKLLADEPAGTAFTVEIQGGGCSGFQYYLDLKLPKVGDGDLVIEENGAKVVVDATSLGLLKGSTLDYVEDLAKAGFEIKNPNATMKCGCGNSFSVI